MQKSMDPVLHRDVYQSSIHQSPTRSLRRPFQQAQLSRRRGLTPCFARAIFGGKEAASRGLWELFGPRLPSPVEDPLRVAADGIRDAIATGSVDNARLAGLVDTLQAAVVPFDERGIGGGPWQVVYTRGPLLWKGWVGPGKLANFNNKASQTFSPRSRTVVNYAEVFGEDFYVQAEGTYEPRGSVGATPVEVSTEIMGARLHAFNRDFKLPIRGKGKFYVMYADDSLRLIQNGPKPTSSLAVQIRAPVLKKLLAEQIRSEQELLGPPAS